MKKDKMINLLIAHWTDAIDIKDLIAFYQDAQREHLEKMSKAEVTKIFKENDYIEYTEGE